MLEGSKSLEVSELGSDIPTLSLDHRIGLYTEADRLRRELGREPTTQEVIASYTAPMAARLNANSVTEL